MGAAARTVLPLVTTGEASGGHRGPADDEGAARVGSDPVRGDAPGRQTSGPAPAGGL